jgi:hypothetical protein
VRVGRVTQPECELDGVEEEGERGVLPVLLTRRYLPVPPAQRSAVGAALQGLQVPGLQVLQALAGVKVPIVCQSPIRLCTAGLWDVIRHPTSIDLGHSQYRIHVVVKQAAIAASMQTGTASRQFAVQSSRAVLQGSRRGGDGRGDIGRRGGETERTPTSARIRRSAADFYWLNPTC